MSAVALGSIAAGVIALLSLPLAAAAYFAARRLRVRCAALEASLVRLHRELAASAAAGAGAPRELSRLEREQAAVAERVAQLEARGPHAALEQAIEWAVRGVDSARLAQQFGLSPSEAELIVQVHGRRQRA